MTKARDLSKLADGTEFTPADHSKLDAIEASATADQTNAEIRAAVEAATDSNVFTDADHSKLNAVEASADVTDTANVTAAGALMDSELTNLAAVKAINQSLVTTASPTFAGLGVTGTATMDGFASNAASSITVSSASITPDADANNLVIQENGAAGITIGSATASVGSIRFADSGNARSGMIYYNHSGDHMRFYTGAAERVRIDSSGRVLVSKTASGAGNVGAEMRTGVNDHAMVATTSGNASPLAVNRQTGGSGPLIQMYIANSHVANLSGDNTRLLVESAGDASGLRFDASGYTPFKNGTTANGTVDLGFSSGRFKDLYLSGGVYLGGTGAANKLDDYEEGAVSLALVGGNGNPSTAVAITGTYVKIGRLVSIRAQNLNFNNTGAQGPIALTGFPFAANGAYGIGNLGETSDLMTFTNPPYIVVSGDAGYIYQNISEANAITVNHHIDTACTINIDVTYETNA